MRFDGVLTKWNDDRGFGFIKPHAGGAEVFVHVSAFPKDGQRPRIGERVSFEVTVDAAGKKKARHVLCLDRRVRSVLASHTGQRGRIKPSWARARSSSRFLANLLSVVVLAIVCAIAYTQFDNYQQWRDLAKQPSTQPAALPSPAQTSRFRCDGRTHCSQMTSCEEATFFINNCPGAKMDGDGDGIPCEQQWCTSGRRFFKFFN